jgi:hypothetical protein
MEEAHRVSRESVDAANRAYGHTDSRAIEVANRHRQLGVEVTRLRTHVDDLTASTTRYNRIASAMSSPGLLTAGIGLSTALSYPSYQLIKQGMLYNSVIENNTTAFKTMLGSLEQAQSMVRDIQSFAVVTPFRTGELADQVKTLTQFGVAAENALPTAKMLGDISLGDPFKFGILAYNYAQANSLGRLQARDAYSMNLAGFNPKTAIEAYRESRGKQKGNIDKEMEQGAVTILELTQAMIYATSEGKKFHDGMLNASKTVSGQWSTLRDNIDITLGAMTKGIFEFVRTSVLPMLIGLTSWITKFAELNPKTTAAITTMLLLGAAIGPVLIGIYAAGQALVYMNLGWTALKGLGLITWFSNLAYAFRIMRINATLAGTSLVSAGLAAAGAWLLVAAKVIAVVAAVAVLAYTTRLVIANWETTKDYFNSLRLFMGSTFGVIGDYITKAFYDGMVVAGGFFDYVRSAISNFSKGKFTGWEVEKSVFTTAAEVNSAVAKDDIDTSIANIYKASDNMTNAYKKMSEGMGDTMVKDWEEFKKLLPDFTFDVKPPTLDVPPIDLTKVPKGGKDNADALDKLKSRIESMVDKIKDQARAFRDALGLFDKAVVEKMSGEKLMLRLRSQFRILESWSASIATLKARLGAGSQLFQQVLAMGPAAAGQTKALANMGDLQLGMYNKMYQDKSNLATGPAGLLVGLQAVEESKLEKIKQVVININGGVVVGNEAQLVDTITKELKRQGVF